MKNNILRKTVATFGLLAAFTGVGSSIAGAVDSPTTNDNSSISDSASSSSFITSKLAKNVSNDPGFAKLDFNMLSSSVLTSGGNSTLVMTFDQNMSQSKILSAGKTNSNTDVSVYLTKENTPTNWEDLYFNVRTGTVNQDYFDSHGNLKTKTIKTSIRYSGKTVSMDFPQSLLKVDAKKEFNARLQYINMGKNSNDFFQYETQTKTSNFKISLHTIDGSDDGE